MSTVNALFLTSTASDWLANTHHPAVLHIFDRACNLINEHRKVLSIVTPEIGNGPFNLVIESNPQFNSHIDLESSISMNPTTLCLGSFTIHTQKARLWDARPDWKTLHANRGAILQQVSLLSNPKPPISNLRSSNSLSSSLAAADLRCSVTAAKQLAGLGQGLTPSGDDYITGALYAAWIIHPHDVTERIAREIATIAIPLTTSLSAAWLSAAAKGEAGVMWHTFLDALVAGEPSDIEVQVSNILSTGATSGADALAGFIDTLISYTELERKDVVPKYL